MSAAGIAEWWTFPDSTVLCNVVDSIEKCKKSLQKFLLAMPHEAQPLKLPKHVLEHKVIWFTQDSFPML